MPLRATAELAWINVSETRIEPAISGRSKCPRSIIATRRRNALSCISRSARKTCRWRSQVISSSTSICRHRIRVPRKASSSSPTRGQFPAPLRRRACREGKRIDELTRQSLMLVTALARRTAYDNAARIAKAAHLLMERDSGKRRSPRVSSGGVRCAGSPGSDAGARRLNSIRQPAEVNAKEQENSHQTAIDNEGPCRKSFKNAQQAPDRGKSR